MRDVTRLPHFLAPASWIFPLWTFHNQSRKRGSEKASWRTRRCQSLAVPGRLQWHLFQNPKLGILSFLRLLGSTFPHLTSTEHSGGINVCTQGDEWLNLDLGGTEWDNRKSLQKALWWKRDNLQASSSLVYRSNCMTKEGGGLRTDARKNSSGIWHFVSCSSLQLS